LLLRGARRVLRLTGAAGKAVAVAAVIFIACSAALVIALLVLPGHAGRVSSFISRIHPLKGLVDSFEGADMACVLHPRLFLKACACQSLIVLLDAGTVWVLIEALGAHAPAAAVFGSFMISNLFRPRGIFPGGLGTVEASSVLALGLVGVSLPVAVSATL